MSEDKDADLIDQNIAAEPVATPEPAKEQPKEPAKDAPAAPQSIRDTIKASITKVNEAAAAKVAAKQDEPASKQAKPSGDTQRGPDGKFLPRDKDDKPSTEKPLQAATTGAGGQKTDAAPGTWPADARATWEQIPPLARTHILRRESELTREVGKAQQQIQQINQVYSPIEQLLGPRRALWRAQHGSEGAALSKLLNLSDLASQQPTEFLAHYLADPNIAARVDLQKVFGNQAPTGGQDITGHPVVKQMQQTINGLQQQLGGFLQSHESQQVNSIEHDISQFAEAKDQSGQLLRPHFEAVREDVFKLLPALRAQFPSDTPTQIVTKAYNIAVNTNETVSSEIERLREERIRNDLETKERARRAQLANKSVPPGAPAGNGQGVSSDPQNLRATLKENFRRFRNGDEQRI